MGSEKKMMKWRVGRNGWALVGNGVAVQMELLV
jgi:hypothetical protein